MTSGAAKTGIGVVQEKIKSARARSILVIEFSITKRGGVPWTNHRSPPLSTTRFAGQSSARKDCLSTETGGVKERNKPYFFQFLTYPCCKPVADTWIRSQLKKRK